MHLEDDLSTEQLSVTARERVRLELQRTAFNDLLCRADTGDQVSQYLVGFAYEHGVGVPENIDRARKYYERASKSRSNTVYVYSPASGADGHGRVIPMRAGPDEPGLAAARSALERLRGD